MSLPGVDAAFASLIGKKAIERKLCIRRNYLYQLRSKLKNDLPISEATKLALLLKAGWHPHDEFYTRADLVKLAKFINTTSEAARNFGPEYIVEKWIVSSRKW